MVTFAVTPRAWGMKWQHHIRKDRRNKCKMDKNSKAIHVVANLVSDNAALCFITHHKIDAMPSVLNNKNFIISIVP